MEKKNIDLTKCNNCRFRAKVDGKDISGKIAVIGSYLTFRYDRENSVNNAVLISFYREHGIGDSFQDFEIVSRDPETYRDWQVGDKVCDYEHRNACYEVIFRSGELVVFKDWNNWASNPMTCSEAFTRFGMRLVLTDIEQQIIEEKKKYEPLDGDICYAISVTGYNDVFICKTGDRKTEYYASTVSDEGGAVTSDENIEVLRPATEEEKQQLFDTMAKRGKRWNAEKKVVEDIPKPYEFRKGEPVLVRNHDNELWSLYAYHEQAGDKHLVKKCFHTILQSQCIPYNERTMHLLGTSEDYK